MIFPQLIRLAKAAIKRPVIGCHKIAQALVHENPGYVLVLSHMRSYSSLLSHILGSHPEISGYFEQHHSYPATRDLDHLHWWSATQDTRFAKPARLLFDKPLHNHLEVGPSVLCSPQVYVIYLLREPADTLTSIAKHFPQWDEGHVIDYYCRRVKWLTARLPESVNTRFGRPYVLLAENIIDDTSNTLVRLTEYLGLSSPLCETYKTFPNTGRIGAGDTSTNASSGKIVRNREKTTIAVGETALYKATRAYDSFLEKCEEAGLSVPSVRR